MIFFPFIFETLYYLNYGNLIWSNTNLLLNNERRRTLQNNIICIETLIKEKGRLFASPWAAAHNANKILLQQYREYKQAISFLRNVYPVPSFVFACCWCINLLYFSLKNARSLYLKINSMKRILLRTYFLQHCREKVLLLFHPRFFFFLLLVA